MSAVSDEGRGVWFSDGRDCIVDPKLKSEINALIQRYEKAAKTTAQRPLNLGRNKGTYTCDMKLHTPKAENATNWHGKLRKERDRLDKQKKVKTTAGGGSVSPAPKVSPKPAGKPFQRRVK